EMGRDAQRGGSGRHVYRMVAARLPNAGVEPGRVRHQCIRRCGAGLVRPTHAGKEGWLMPRPTENGNPAGELPLGGIRVCDLTWIVAGPTATRVLADFGAEVIRVEHGQSVDAMRFAPPIIGEQPTGNNSGTFNYFNRNKKSVLLNARHPMGMEVLRRLIASCDVVIENFSSRVMESWGLDYPQLKEINTRIIY